MQSDWGINLMDVVTKGFEMVVVSKWMAVKKKFWIWEPAIFLLLHQPVTLGML